MLEEEEPRKNRGKREKELKGWCLVHGNRGGAIGQKRDFKQARTCQAINQKAYEGSPGHSTKHRGGEKADEQERNVWGWSTWQPAECKSSCRTLLKTEKGEKGREQKEAKNMTPGADRPRRSILGKEKEESGMDKQTLMAQRQGLGIKASEMLKNRVERKEKPA